jgi:hypothetical protein
MSQRAPAGRGIAPPTLPGSTNEYDGLWRDIIDRMTAIAESYASTMGTVLSVSGGRVRVQVDGENKPRGIGFPRAKGVGYSVGDRVRLDRTKGGAWIVGGIVGDGSADGSVGHGQISPGAVASDSLASDLSGKIASIGDKASLDQLNSAVSDLQKQINTLSKAHNDVVTTYNKNFNDIWDRLDALEARVFKRKRG